jgi:ABC-type transport system substrate-binding protein
MYLGAYKFGTCISHAPYKAAAPVEKEALPVNSMNYWTQTLSRRMVRRRLLAGGVVAGAGVATAALVGCGGRRPSAASSGSSSATQSIAKQPKRGGTISIMVTYGETPNLDPHLTGTVALHQWGAGVAYARLIDRKIGPDIQAAAQIIPAPWVAQSWEQPDETTYLFKLNPAAKWQNIAPVNGRQLTAEDVAYSGNRQVALKVNAGFLPDVDKFTAVDPQTLRVTLKEPNPDFLVSVANVQNKIVAREAVELKGDLKDGPTIGAGAWIFKEWIPENVVRFVRNPDYWLKDQLGIQFPYLDALEILRLPDLSTRIAALRTRKILTTYGGTAFGWEQATLLQREIPALRTIELQPASGTPQLQLNLRVDTAPMNDPRVRQALSKALDRVALTQALDPQAPPGRLASGMVSSTSDDQLLPEDEIKKALAQDVAGAKQLLDAAGVKNWTPEIWDFNLGEGTVRPSAELMQRQLAAVGINATLRLMDNVKLTTWAYNNHDLPFAIYYAYFYLNGPHAYLSQGFKTNGDRNVTHVSDPQLDSLIDGQAKERDAQRRAQLIQQAQRRMLELTVAIPASYEIATPILSYPEVQGTYPGATGYDSLWLDA